MFSSLVDNLMILTFKTLTGQDFSMDFDPDTTIGEVLNKICQERGEEVEKAKLIYAGKQLNDSSVPISAIGYDPSKYIILFLKGGSSKSKSKESQPPPKQEKSESKEETKSSTEDSNKPTESDQKESPKEKPKEPEKTKEELFQESLQNIVDMGFDRQIAQEALIRASGSQQIALDLILKGYQPFRSSSQRRHEQEEQINERRRLMHSLRTTPVPKHQKYTSVSELPGFSIASDRKMPWEASEIRMNFLDNADTIDSIERIVQRRGLHILDAMRENRVPMLTMLGFRVLWHQFSGLSYTPFIEVLDQELIDALNIMPEEIPVIRRLARTGHRIQEILRIYRSTESEEQTYHILTHYLFNSM